MNETLFACETLTVRRPDGTNELDNLSFSLAPGERLTLLGEAGSGKEALMRALGNFRNPGETLTGSLRVRDEPPVAAQRGRIGLRVVYMPGANRQPFSPHASVAEQLVRVLARNSRNPRASAAEELRIAWSHLEGAPDFALLDAKPTIVGPILMSWGLMTVALAQNPELLLADHFFADLPPIALRALCAALLAEQKRMNFALIAAVGSVRNAEALAGRTIILRNGKLVEEGEIARLSGSSAHSYTQSYFAADLKLDPQKPQRIMPRGESLLQVQALQLTKPAPDTKAETLSFELRRGASLALIGEEGSGRRRLVRAVLGLDRLDAKRILFDAVDINILSSAMALRLRRRIAFITGADDALDPRMTLWDTIDEPLRSHLGLSRDMLAGHREAALKRVGLASLPGNRRVATLSSFDRRRLQIARAIVATPLLTVVDEPLRGLDGFAANVIRELLVDFRGQEGPAFFIVTADFAIAQALADDAMVFKDQAVIERGPIAEMLKSPKEAHTRRLIEAAQPALLQPAAEG